MPLPDAALSSSLMINTRLDSPAAEKAEECVVTEDGLDAIVELHKNTSGIRDLEQAAEHIAANALYQIEVDHLTGVTFNAEMVRELLS